MSRPFTPSTLRFGVALPAIVVALMLPFAAAHGAVPDYKLGDTVTEDVVTPVSLLVINPEATAVLQQKVAEQVPFVVRQSSHSAAEAEAELRQSIATARATFLASLRRASPPDATTGTEINAAAVETAMADTLRDAPKDLPLAQLAPFWLRAAEADSVVESLLEPLRSVMQQPVVNGKTDATFPANQSVRLISVKSLSDPPTAQEIESPGLTVSSGKIISLWRARRLVETYFPSGQEAMGRFAASFVKPTAVPDPGLTDVLRARKMEGVTANDTYDAAQIVVHKGQVIDRKALAALAMMREKSLIGALQTKLEQEQSVAGQIKKQTKWMAVGLGAVCLALTLILWRLRSRPSTALVPVGAGANLPEWEPRALPGGHGEEGWRQRAIVAEGRAERAQEAIRSGVLAWMREKIFRTLFRHRDELLSAQQKAEAEMRELEQRLEQLHTPLQERIVAYEKRIDELEKDLAAKGEENRKLIGARISVAKQQLILERKRGRFGTN